MILYTVMWYIFGCGPVNHQIPVDVDSGAEIAAGDLRSGLETPCKATFLSFVNRDVV